MRKLVKIKFSAFNRYTHFGFMEKSNMIYQQIEANNTVFGLTPAELTALQENAEQLAALTLKAGSESGSKVDRDARDLQASVMLTLLIQTGINKVLAVACTKPTYEEQKAIVTLAGYPIGNDSHNPIPLQQVEGVELSTSGIPGVSTVNVSWKRNKAAAYIVQTAPGATYGPATVWTDSAFITTSKYQLPLSAGTWSVRIVAVSGTEQAVPSDPVAIVVG